MYGCVYRNIDEGCGSILDIVIIIVISVDGLISPCGVLLDESCDGDKVFLSDGKEKRTFEKECEVADALVQISGMLVDAAQILRDCHKVRRCQIYGRLDAVVRPTLTPNAKCKHTF